MTGRRGRRGAQRPPGGRPLAVLLIGMEKAGGALLAMAVAAFAIADGGRGLSAPVAVAMVAETGDLGRELVGWVLIQLSPGTVGWGDAVGVYGILLIAEGVGILQQRAWAEVLAIVETALWIPVEAFSMAALPSFGEGVVIGVNLAILAYLANRRGWWGLRKYHAAAEGTSGMAAATDAAPVHRDGARI